MRAREGRDGRHLVVLERGEDLRSCLVAFARRRGLGTASVAGVGALEQVELGYYDLASREYSHVPVPGIVELVNLSGNLARRRGEPFLHVHAVVAGPDLVPRAGHLHEARVAITAELVVVELGAEVERERVEEVGLDLLRP